MGFIRRVMNAMGRQTTVWPWHLWQTILGTAVALKSGSQGLEAEVPVFLLSLWELGRFPSTACRQAL